MSSDLIPGFGSDGISDISPEDLQRKLYFLNEKLQIMAKDLPPKYQQRIPNELLCGLAESLLDNTVFGIVDNLMDIQHVTEKQLFQQRLQFMNKHTLALQELMMNTQLDEETKAKQRSLMQASHKKEMQLFDMKLVTELDKKVSDQQRILEMAGVPGFEVTSDPVKIQVQIRLLDFILRLSQMQLPP
ncbi:gonadal protein gdl [Macrosteles quadrilineatus]|uniref:gonadal protein gdl n=1 Tax=Macrosteles quadrilineatus TaxID=74068 RepID=UPI0023E104C0|nr:gonadal protein gdl [Macrosteles quadrilineatus]